MINKILKNKKIIFVAGDERRRSGRFIEFILSDYFSTIYFEGTPCFFDIFSLIKSDIVIIEDNESVDFEKMKKTLHSASWCIFVITVAENKSRIRNLISGFKKEWRIVSDFSVSKKLEKRKTKETLIFGIERKKADVYITDISVKEGGTNFKVNNNFNIIPFWVKKELKKKEVYSILPGLCIAKIMDLNLAEISHKVKEGR
jgi:hypothetical protein